MGLHQDGSKMAFLEGLRGVCALIVVMGHLKMTFCLGLSHRALQFLGDSFPPFLSLLLDDVMALFTEGNLPVHIFWVLSAYVISIKLFDPVKIREDTLFNLLFRRYFRLFLPCLTAILFAYFLMKLGVFYHLEVARKLGTAYGKGWLGSHYLFTADFVGAVQSAVWNTFFYYDINHTYNNVLWTIAVEWEGSVFLFFLFGVSRQNEKRHFLYLIICILAALWQEYWIFCFLLGFFLSELDYSYSRGLFWETAKAIDNFIRRYQTLLLLFFFMVLLVGTPFLTYIGLSKPYIPTLLSLLILYLVLRTEKVKVFFSNPVFVWLGKISFGLYLLHIPILFSVGCGLYLVLPFSSFGKIVLASSATLALSFLGASLFTTSVDKPSVRWSKKIGDWMGNRL